DEQVIEFAPGHAEKELLNRFDDHRPAPNHRRIAFDQEAHAHQMDAVIRRRNEFFIRVNGGLFVNAHHERDAWAVDVTIEQADAGAEMPQTARDVHGCGALADAAFAAGDGNDVLDAGNFVLIGPRAGPA